MAWRPVEAGRGEEILINAKVRFHAASTMKLPVMIELFRQIDKKRLKLEDTVVVSKPVQEHCRRQRVRAFRGSDSDNEMCKAIGRPMTLRDLCEPLITTSSNLAANILIPKSSRAEEHPIDVQPSPRRVGHARAARRGRSEGV